MMPIFPILMLLFLAVPIAEIYVLIGVGGAIGVGYTIGLVVLTAVVGAALMRAEGLATLRRMQTEMNQGGLPAQHLIEGVMLLFAGALLLTPGFLTDGVGFLLLFRPTRVAMAHWFLSRSAVRVQQGFGPGMAGGFGGPQGPQNRPGGARPRDSRRPGGSAGANGVIEGEFSHEQSDKP